MWGYSVIPWWGKSSLVPSWGEGWLHQGYWRQHAAFSPPGHCGPALCREYTAVGRLQLFQDSDNFRNSGASHQEIGHPAHSFPVHLGWGWASRGNHPVSREWSWGEKLPLLTREQFSALPWDAHHEKSLNSPCSRLVLSFTGDCLASGPLKGRFHCSRFCFSL